ncbi:GNAT family N-acetyltransferase [Herbaspirillum camelliae]|uniref:GNAT family N-acetyltransferase n=1 Tax=Herbaspirillum camelliae TaxID=1892903 RepID=UPI000949F1E2|nr:GNAT family N-acetyltransferase [Herbaspirillum camelliae]
MIKIRRAQPGDATTLYRAECTTSRTPGLLVSDPEELSESSFYEKILWLGEAGIYVVAEVDGAPAGHALLEPGAMRATAHVFSLTIVVHPGNTGRGIGTALMEFLLAWAADNHVVEKIELRVREGNLVAKRLYDRFGFVEEGRFSKRIRLPDGSYLADISMAKFLTT